MSTPQTVLVTGASGHLGQEVLEFLLEANTSHIIAATRSPEKLAAFAARGVEVRQADFDDPSTLTAAFAGADRLLLISTDALGIPGKRIAQHKAAVAAAVAAGVKHVVYTSLSRPEPGSPILIAPDHYATEQALAATALDWTILRNNMYTDFSLMSLPRAVASGQLISAGGDAGVGYVTHLDCARAAAAALNSTTGGKRIFEITGPEIINRAQLAAVVSEITGRPIEYIPITLEQLIDGMVASGMPRPVAETLASFEAGEAAGTLAITTDAVKELTGVAPQSVRDFLTAHREALLAG